MGTKNLNIRLEVFLCGRNNVEKITEVTFFVKEAGICDSKKQTNLIKKKSSGGE